MTGTFVLQDRRFNTIKCADYMLLLASAIEMLDLPVVTLKLLLDVLKIHRNI